MSTAYAGYRVKIGNTTINNDMIQRGSFKVTPLKRKVATWLDANQTEHEDIVSKRKYEISFGIRPRTLTEHEAIKGIFATQENVSVTYWDDLSCTYKTCTCRMDAPVFAHENTLESTIRYAATTIKLTEY